MADVRRIDDGTADDVGDQKLIVVTSDSHVGPSVEQLRQYCPKKFVDAFDGYYARNHLRNEDGYRDFPVDPDNPTPKRDLEMAAIKRDPADFDRIRESPIRNALTDGGFDMAARVRDMDADGVAAEVIYHGLVLGPTAVALPFAGSHPFLAGYDADLELSTLGRHIYNQWLSDAIASTPEPERHIGLAQLPMWDVDAALKELTWAAEAGLRGINFPRSGSAGVLAYNDRGWEPFWDRCEELNMTLNTHAQGQLWLADGTNDAGSREGHFIITVLDMVSYASRLSLHYLIFGGVFERHPGLKIVFAEQPGLWWTETMNYMDDIFVGHTRFVGRGVGTSSKEHGKLSRLPSEYGSQIFIGATCLASFEAADAIAEGYDSQVMWGSDYPHAEGTYQYPRTDDEKETMTRLAQRDAFAGLDPEPIRSMLGGNAIECYGLNRSVLQSVADRINAPTLADLARPIDFEPEPAVTRGAYFVFRKSGAYT